MSFFLDALFPTITVPANQLGTPPTSLNTAARALSGGIAGIAGIILQTTSNTTPTTYVNIAGTGVVEFCAAITVLNVAFSGTLTLVIDGRTYTCTTAAAQYSAVVPVGSAGVAQHSLAAIPFNSSLSISGYVADATQILQILYKYRQTS